MFALSLIHIYPSCTYIEVYIFSVSILNNKNTVIYAPGNINNCSVSSKFTTITFWT